MPGGAIQFAPNIPINVGAAPFTKTHSTIAQTLIDRRRAPDQFFRPVTAANAEIIIERAFKSEIETILSRLDAETMPLSVSLRLSEDHANIDLLITTNTFGVFTPDWFNDEKIKNIVKAAVWDALRTHMRKIIPMGDLSDLVNFYADYYWDGAKTDDEARTNLIDTYGEVPGDHILLPSELAAATPKWTKAPTKRQLQRLPHHIAEAIEAVRKAANQFENRLRTTNAWDFTYDAVIEIEPAYEESAAMPPMWLVPMNNDLIDALDEISQHAMQTSFYDVCGATRLSTKNQLSHWLDDFTAGVDFLAALAHLIQIDPRR